MEVQIKDPAAQLAAKNPTLNTEDIRKILAAKDKHARKVKRARKAKALQSRQRNAKSGHLNHFKLTIINDMFEDEPEGYAHEDSKGRKYYTCNGTTVRL